MKLGIAMGALTLVSVGAANAAIATYDFESASVGAISVGSFGGALAPLGITSSTLSGTTGGQRGVYVHAGNMNANAGLNTTLNYGAQSFGIGNTGETWTLTFGGLGINSFQFDYNETELVGFTVRAYNSGDTLVYEDLFNPSGSASQIDQVCGFIDTCGTRLISGVGAIFRIEIIDRGNDGLQIDNLVVDTIVPETSTYLMVGSALAGLAYFRRRA